MQTLASSGGDAGGSRQFHERNHVAGGDRRIRATFHPFGGSTDILSPYASQGINDSGEIPHGPQLVPTDAVTAFGRNSTRVLAKSLYNLLTLAKTLVEDAKDALQWEAVHPGRDFLCLGCVCRSPVGFSTGRRTRSDS